VGVERILGRAARVAGVRLSDGTELPADVVIVGVGMRPNVAALLAAGARGDATGVEIDGECRTSLSAVYAMGDCARQVNSWSSSAAPLRVESVHNASQHAAAVARAIGGLPAAEQAPPRFWSTQYGYELKTVGLVAATDEEVLRGDPSQDQFSVVYLRNGRMAAIDTINRPRDFARAQALVAGWWQPPRLGALADPDIELPRLERALLH
jgi:3-phenylpropionate/trans-cinnamate dioxygenase ferredoxin reductase subunit